MIKISRVMLYAILVLLAIVMLVPLIISFFFSFKTAMEVASLSTRWELPSGFHIENFVTAFQIMAPKLGNSIIVSVPAVIATVFIASLAAFGLTRFNFRLKKMYFYLIVIATLIPAYSIVGPIYSIWNSVGLTNSYLGLILINLIISLPYATIILRSFFQRIPVELIEAAKIEGCSYLGLYWRICMPIAKPALISTFILEFTFIWNDFLWPLILTPSEQYHTMTIGLLRFTGQHVIEWHTMAAAALISSIPPLIFFIVFQRYFIKGILGGSFIKG